MNTFDEISAFCSTVTDLISNRRDLLTNHLCRCESFETAAYEIDRSIDCLRNIGLEKMYLKPMVDTAATFMPLNLPLYSTVIFALIPSVVAKKVHVRAPGVLSPIFAQLQHTLALGRVAPNVIFHHLDRKDFVERFLPSAEAVIFTGKIENANTLRKKLRRDCVFIFNGRGINPVVIGPGANLPEAIAKTIYVKIFNSGQDCAAPDMVLVHRSLMRDTVQLLAEGLSQIPCGDYHNPQVRVGPLLEHSQLEVAAKFLTKHQQEIRTGGMINFPRQIVDPTLIAYDQKLTINYEELFSPILFVSVYEDDDDLKLYFETDQYKSNAMYVTLFGDSNYLQKQKHSIVLEQQIIHDVERGNLEYGGYAHGASFVEFNRNSVAKPILICREIATYKLGTPQ